MPYSSLQEFLQALESHGQLRHIHAEVDPVLEISAITDRVSKAPDESGYTPYSGPRNQDSQLRNQALLFHHVKGSNLPLCINVFGSYRRMHLALGCDSFDQLARASPPSPVPKSPSAFSRNSKRASTC